MADVLVVGRLLADIYPEQLRTRLAEIRSFRRFVGGFAGNVAAVVAVDVEPAGVDSLALEERPAELTVAVVADAAQYRGVDAEPGEAGHRTALAFVEAWPPDHFPITYYRTPTCPDWRIDFDTFSLEKARAIPWCLLTGTGLVRSPSRDVHLALAQERTDTATVFDLDFREMLWDDLRPYRTYGQALLSHVRLVVGNEAEFEALSGLEPHQGARAALAAGAEVAILRGRAACSCSPVTASRRSRVYRSRS